MLNRVLDNRMLNKRLGKKVLFIEGLPFTKDKIMPFIKENKVTKVFCLSPVDYTQSKYAEQTNQKEYEQTCLDVYSELKKRKIKIIPHIHLKADTIYREARRKIRQTIKWFGDNGISTDEICFGWWLECNNFEKICEELNIKKISKRQFHYYDFWKK